MKEGFISWLLNKAMEIWAKKKAIYMEISDVFIWFCVCKKNTNFYLCLQKKNLQNCQKCGFVSSVFLGFGLYLLSPRGAVGKKETCSLLKKKKKKGKL